MDFLEAFERCTSHGWLTIAEARALFFAAKGTEGPMLEVGCYLGRSAMLLAQLGRPLYCVDPWADGFSTDFTGQQMFDRFKENLAPWPNVIQCRQRIEDWEPRPMQFVYLDGDHTKEGTEAQTDKALQCSPSIIAIHDLANDGEGRIVAEVAHCLLGTPDIHVERLGIWRLKP
jgi:hypothetical protein